MPSAKHLAITLALHAALFIVYGLGFLTLMYCFLG